MTPPAKMLGQGRPLKLSWAPSVPPRIGSTRRLHANEIPLQSRYGSGVRVMRLGENDKVMVLARTDHDDEAQTEQIDTSDADAEPTAEQLAAMEAADAASAAETPEADDKSEE